MINFPSTGLPVQPTNRRLLRLLSRSQGNSRESLDPLPTTSIALCLIFTKIKNKTKNSKDAYTTISDSSPPILTGTPSNQVFIPSTPAACVCVVKSDSQSEGQSSAQCGLSLSPFFPEASSLRAPPPILLYFFHAFLSPPLF